MMKGVLGRYWYIERTIFSALVYRQDSFGGVLYFLMTGFVFRRKVRVSSIFV